MVIGKCGTIAYYLKDRCGHKLMCSMPASHLVRFFEKSTYKGDGSSSEIHLLSTNDVESDEEIKSNYSETCQRVYSQNCHNGQYKSATPKKSSETFASKIVIISSKELPVLSDKSSAIDMGNEYKADVPSPINLWDGIDIKDIPIEIVDHFSDMEEDFQITDVTKRSRVYFQPLSDDDRKVAAMKFNLVITGKSHPVKYTGVEKMCPYPPVITQAAKSNGACFLTAFPCFWLVEIHTVQLFIMLYATTYQIQWNTDGYRLTSPQISKVEKDYVIASNMHNFSTWGTEVEIIALAHISGFDMYVYTKNSGWLWYAHCISNGEDEKSEHAFFVSNESGGHFDPVFDA